MKPETWPRVRGLFEAALDLEPDQREAFLERECAGDGALLGEVLALLRADTGESGATPLLDTDPRSVLATRDLVGATIGGFRVVRLLGAGGMGAVYEAQQERPQRTVALKTLAVRFPSERARRRFEDEADILARLRHPAIAQVLAAGTTRIGELEVPWFAMELVEEPRTIDCFAREQQLDVRATLALFATVCDAVHYAHQSGVIHRDLKPANVLVDRHGRAKLIDFGIARFAERDALSRFTRTGEILGTLAYMSPERLERADRGDHGDNVPADIYALGVILYELLAGRSPFLLGELPPARAMEVLRAADPPPPSRVAAAIPVELDWITAKAMAREPGRRYASVAELAQDLHRFARHEPLAAGPPSATYRLRKLAWRHRVLLGTATAAFVAVSIGFVVAMRGWSRVEAAERLAQRKAQTLTEVNRFQDDILRGAYGSEKGSDVRLVDVIDKAVVALEAKQFTDPVVEIGARTSIGVSYLGLGRLQDAERHLLRARMLLDEHGFDPREGWGMLVSNHLALVHEEQGKHEQAERDMRRSLADRIAAYGADHEHVAVGQSNLANMLMDRGQFAEALELALTARRTLQRVRGEHSDYTINAHGLVARALSGLRRDEEAEQAFAATRALAERHLHHDHPGRLGLLSAYAAFLFKLRRFEDAVVVQQEVAASRERVSGPEHPSTLQAWSSLAAGQAELGRHADAEAICRRVAPGWEALGVRGGFEYLATMQNLVACVRRQGRAAEAEPLARGNREAAARTLPKGHWLAGVVTKEHGACLRELGRMEEAEAALLEAHEVLARAAGAGDYRTQKVVAELVALYEAWPRPELAEQWNAKRASAKR